MSDERPRRRPGLEALPINPGEAFTFHAIRNGRPMSEVRSIVFLRRDAQRQGAGNGRG
ncbi:MAG TPA: hypothetical protein VGO28_10975 [Acidimicrobiia bacterium]